MQLTQADATCAVVLRTGRGTAEVAAGAEPACFGTSATDAVVAVVAAGADEITRVGSDKTGPAMLCDGKGSDPSVVAATWEDAGSEVCWAEVEPSAVSAIELGRTVPLFEVS